MSNQFAPFGLQPVRRLDGAAWSDQLTTMLIGSGNAHSFFRGDLIAILSTGYIDRLAGSSSFAQTYSGIGVFWGCELAATTSGSPWSQTYVASSQPNNDCKAFIIMDPNVVFRCQAGSGAAPGSAGGPVTLSQVWQNAPFLNGTGNTSSGQSGGYLDAANIAATATLPLQIVNLVGQTNTTATASAGPLVGPPLGTNGTDLSTAGNYVEVTLNQAIFKVGQTGI